MRKEELDAFLDAVDKAKSGDKTAFDGVSIQLDGEEEASPAFGLENKKERKRQDD